MSREDEKRTLVSQACVEWQDDIRAFLLGVLRGREHLDDAWQRTVVSAMNAAESVEPPTLRGWLFRIALNEARQIRRTLRRQAVWNQKISSEMAQVWFRKSSGQSVADGALVREELIAEVRRAMERLPEEQRRVVVMRVYDGKSFAQIAEETGRPIGTVLTWMRRALLKMKDDPSLRSLADHGLDESV